MCSSDLHFNKNRMGFNQIILIPPPTHLLDFYDWLLYPASAPSKYNELLDKKYRTSLSLPPYTTILFSSDHVLNTNSTLIQTVSSPGHLASQPSSELQHLSCVAAPKCSLHGPCPLPGSTKTRDHDTLETYSLLNRATSTSSCCLSGCLYIGYAGP